MDREGDGAIDASQLCRVCGLFHEYLIPIFEGEGLEHDLGPKIQQHLHLQIADEDILPLQICYQCAAILVEWHDLVCVCEEANQQIWQPLKKEQYEDADENNAAFEYEENVSPECDAAGDESIELSSNDVQNEYKELAEKNVLLAGTSALTEESEATDVSEVATFKQITSQGMSTSEMSQPSAIVNSTEDLEDSKSSLKENPIIIRAVSVGKIERNINSEFVNTAYVSTHSIVMQKDDMIITEDIDCSDINLEVSKSHISASITRNIASTGVPRSYNNKKSSSAVCTSLGLSKQSLHTRVASAMVSSATNTKHDELRFHCRYCGSNFHGSSLLKEHLTHCNAMNDINIRLSQPLTRDDNGKYVCAVCGKEYKYESYLRTHLQVHVGKPWKKHSTPCKEMNGVNDLLPLDENGNYVCTICGKLYKWKSSFRNHLKAHTGQPILRIKCKVCGEKFLKNAEIVEHMKSHENNDLLTCEYCDKTFASRMYLLDHIISHTSVCSFTCAICGARYKRKSHLKRHIIGNIHKTRKNPVKGHICELCGKTLATKRTFRQHMVIHTGEKNSECSLCGKRFSFKTTMKRHIHNVHFGAKDFSCPICNEWFTTKITLKNHLRIHSGEKPYECETCHKAFRSKQQLRIHMRGHSDSRPYTCPFCPKTFRRLWSLTTHKRSHTGERPHWCTQCGKSFIRKDYLIRHVQACGS